MLSMYSIKNVVCFVAATEAEPCAKPREDALGARAGVSAGPRASGQTSVTPRRPYSSQPGHHSPPRQPQHPPPPRPQPVRPRQGRPQCQHLKVSAYPIYYTTLLYL